MNCPRCVDEPMKERLRDAVAIEVCGACRGIWLVRGELEKLIARSEAPSRRRPDEDERPSSDSPRRHRRASWLDIFD